MQIYYRDTGPDHSIRAFDEGQLIGEIVWSKRTRAVRIVWVHPGYRRKGIATQLWERANVLPVSSPKHAKDQTQAGKRWISSLGEQNQ